MKRIIKLNEYDLTRIVKRVLKENLEQKINTMKTEIKNDLSSDQSLISFQGKASKVCQFCIKKYPNADKIPACNSFCTTKRIGRNQAYECIENYIDRFGEEQEEDHPAYEDMPIQYRFTNCIYTFVKSKKIKQTSSRGYEDIQMDING